MGTVSLTLDEIFELAKKTLLANGCDDETASILSDLIRNAERDGSVSHGLFRLPAYVTGLKGGKINGKGKPEVKNAHPHTDSSGTIAVVQNGIIENFQELKNKLEKEGIVFNSDTDTEVIPHLIERELNTLIKNKKDSSDKYFFVTNNGRWTGFIDENILKTVSIKKWERNLVGDFKKPIDSFESVYSNDKLWKTIERLEETGEGFILVLNAADIPLGIVDRSNIGNFVLNKLGFNLPSEIVNKLNYKNQYPLGIELPRIINLMKQKGDL